MLLPICLKHSKHFDIAKCLSAEVQRAHGRGFDIKYYNTLKNINNLRREIVDRINELDTSDTLVNLIKQYIQHLELVASTFGIAAENAEGKFCWMSSFNRRRKRTSKKLSFEILCQYYNIGSIYTNIACCQDMKSEEGLLSAFQYFNMANTMFDECSLRLNNLNMRDLTFDLTPQGLSFTKSFISAQATECLFYRYCLIAQREAVDIQVIANSAVDVKKEYSTATRQIKHFKWPDILNDYRNLVKMKGMLFDSLSNFHRARVNNLLKEYGEEVSRLRAASIMLKDAKTVNKRLPKHIRIDMAIFEMIPRMKTKSKRDNNLVYHCLIPRQVSLPSVEAKAIAVGQESVF